MAIFCKLVFVGDTNNPLLEVPHLQLHPATVTLSQAVRSFADPSHNLGLSRPFQNQGCPLQFVLQGILRNPCQVSVAVLDPPKVPRRSPPVQDGRRRLPGAVLAHDAHLPTGFMEFRDRDNGKEDGSYHLEFRVWGLGGITPTTEINLEKSMGHEMETNFVQGLCND